MTVKSILSLAAEFLGVGDVLEQHFISVSEEGTRLQKKLLRCFWTVECEAATDYLPFVCEETVTAEEGIVLYSALQKTPTRILGVYSEEGKRLEYELFPSYLKTSKGKAVLRYAYLPTEKGILETVEAHPAASARLFAYGVAAQDCLSEGLYEEAAVWENKYREAVLAATQNKPCRVMRSRAWR